MNLAMADLNQKPANIPVYPRYPRLKCLIRGSGAGQFEFDEAGPGR